MNTDALPKEILSKGEQEHLWREIKLLSEAKKAPQGTYITKEVIGEYQVIHAIMPLGMSWPSLMSWESILLGALFLVVYTGVVIKSWDFIKRKEDISKPFGCRKCEVWFESAQEYIDHWRKVHESKVDAPKSE